MLKKIESLTGSKSQIKTDWFGHEVELNESTQKFIDLYTRDTANSHLAPVEPSKIFGDRLESTYDLLMFNIRTMQAIEEGARENLGEAQKLYDEAEFYFNCVLDNVFFNSIYTDEIENILVDVSHEYVLEETDSAEFRKKHDDAMCELYAYLQGGQKFIEGAETLVQLNSFVE